MSERLPMSPAGNAKTAAICRELAALVTNPGEDSAAIILHNHHSFVLDLAKQLKVDLTPVPQPKFHDKPGVPDTVKKGNASLDDTPNLGAGTSKACPISIPEDEDVQMKDQGTTGVLDAEEAGAGPGFPINTIIPAPAFVPINTIGHVNTKAPASTVAPTKATAPAKTKATVPVETRAPAKVIVPAQAKAIVPVQAKATVPVETRAPAKAIVPAQAKATVPASTAASTSRSPPRRVLTITMALQPGTTTEDLAQAMDTFARDIADASLNVRVDNKEVPDVHLTNAEVELITKFFFKDVFGPAARLRVQSLFNYVMAAEERGEELLSSERASALAHQEDIPPDFRAFFDNFGRFFQDTRGGTSVYARTLAHWHQYKLYETFDQLQDTAYNTPEAYKAFLARQDLKMGVGQSTKTPILSYLCRALGLERARLRNVLQHSQGIHLLARTFGPGVLLLVPNGTANILTRFGIQKVTAVMPFAAKAFGDDARTVCKLAYDNILRHLVDGTDPPTPLAAVPSTRSLSSLSLLEALSPGEEEDGEETPLEVEEETAAEEGEEDTSSEDDKEPAHSNRSDDSDDLMFDNGEPLE